jgi:hypothetical protein
MMDNLLSFILAFRYFDTFIQQFKEVSINNMNEIAGDQIFKLWPKKKIDEL